MYIRNICLLAPFLLSLATTPTLAQQMTREEKVRADRAKVEAEGFWIYNDLDKAYRIAEETGKPLLVVLRCIPCEECVKLDDELVDTDPVLRPLLDQFVCVRIVGTNGLDLDTFQFDTDQSFAVFMLNADKTIYGRFGTRSHRTEWLGDVSLEGMARALEGALQLHEDYPNNREKLQAKRGKPLEFSSPEKYPIHKDKYTDQLNYSGDVVKSCIHCHQIGDARRDYYWSGNEVIPEDLMYPYPHPKSIGLVLDPKKRAQVLEVVPGSPASQSGIQPGDDILAMANQPLLSIADVQWVLNQTSPQGGEILLELKRDNQSQTATLKLPAGWRQADDISWRVSSWGIRRMTTGGMVLTPLSPEEKSALGIDTKMALKVKSAGKFGPHAAARQAGFLPDDVLISLAGNNQLEREQDWFWFVLNRFRAGDEVAVELLRAGRKQSLKLPIQE